MVPEREVSMHEKIYDITFDCDGWSCRTGGTLVGTFPSWLLAIGATKAAAERDRRSGIASIIRYQDLKGTMHTLDLDAESTAQPPSHHDPKAINNIDRIASGQRPN
jgi:hypothetical protein